MTVLNPADVISRLQKSTPTLSQELRSLLDQIPSGRVTTYGHLAAALGSNAAARWIGAWMLEHPHDRDCPCHRVVRHDGEVGLYLSRDSDEKRRRLRDEGVVVDNGRVDLKRFRFEHLQCDAPLARLAELQAQIPGLVSLLPTTTMPETAAGLDVSYAGANRATAAYAAVETGSLKLIASTVLHMRVGFPYVPGFLAFRELPVLIELWRKVRRELECVAPLVIVDGNGLLHHRRAGIATHFGVVADIPTIGIGKKLLCGQVDLKNMSAGEARPVTHQGDIVGTALKSKHSSRPIYVSPGQHVDVDSAARIVQQLFGGHRLPEPLYWADALSRRAAENRVSGA